MVRRVAMAHYDSSSIVQDYYGQLNRKDAGEEIHFQDLKLENQEYPCSQFYDLKEDISLKVPEIPGVYIIGQEAQSTPSTRNCFREILKIFTKEQIDHCHLLYPDYTSSAVCLMVTNKKAQEVKEKLKRKLQDKRMVDLIKTIEIEDWSIQSQTGECVPGSGVIAIPKPLEDELMTHAENGLIPYESLKEIQSQTTIACYAMDKDSDDYYMLTVAHGHIGHDSDFLKKANLVVRNTHFFLYEVLYNYHGDNTMYKKLSSEHVSLYGTYLDRDYGRMVTADVCAIKIPPDVVDDMQMCVVRKKRKNKKPFKHATGCDVNSFPCLCSVLKSEKKKTEIFTGDLYVVSVGPPSLGPYISYLGCVQVNDGDSQNTAHFNAGDSGASVVKRFRNGETTVEIYGMHSGYRDYDIVKPSDKTETFQKTPTRYYLAFPINNQLQMLKQHGELNLELVTDPFGNV